MPTTNQLLKRKRRSKKVNSKSRALDKCPQKRGICLRVYTTTPKKPNSALRKIARLKLSNGREVNAYIPGEGHTLQEHSVIYIEGGRVPDVPGCGYHAVRTSQSRGDLLGVEGRKQSRSRYGMKKG